MPMAEHAKYDVYVFALVDPQLICRAENCTVCSLLKLGTILVVLAFLANEDMSKTTTFTVLMRFS